MSIIFWGANSCGFFHLKGHCSMPSCSYVPGVRQPIYYNLSMYESMNVYMYLCKEMKHIWKQRTENYHSKKHDYNDYTQGKKWQLIEKDKIMYSTSLLLNWHSVALIEHEHNSLRCFPDGILGLPFIYPKKTPDILAKDNNGVNIILFLY